jgi:hypothetical protein
MYVVTTHLDMERAGLADQQLLALPVLGTRTYKICMRNEHSN